jgi:hypothetical protein
LIGKKTIFGGKDKKSSKNSTLGLPNGYMDSEFTFMNPRSLAVKYSTPVLSVMTSRVQYISVLSIVSLLFLGGFGTVFATNGETPGPNSICPIHEAVNVKCDINETGLQFSLSTHGDINGLVGGKGVLIICEPGTVAGTGHGQCPGDDASRWSDILGVTVKSISATAFETDVVLLSEPNTVATSTFCDEFFLTLPAPFDSASPCVPVSTVLALSAFLGGHANEGTDGCVCDISFSNTASENVVLNIHSDGADTTTTRVPEFGLPSVAFAAIALFAFVLLTLVKGKQYNARRI